MKTIETIYGTAFEINPNLDREKMITQMVALLEVIYKKTLDKNYSGTAIMELVDDKLTLKYQEMISTYMGPAMTKDFETHAPIQCFYSLVIALGIMAGSFMQASDQLHGLPIPESLAKELMKVHHSWMEQAYHRAKEAVDVYHQQNDPNIRKH